MNSLWHCKSDNAARSTYYNDAKHMVMGGIALLFATQTAATVPTYFLPLD
jgi:hypothetical protein